MLDSYDSVTPKRRPVIRVIFAALIASAIFGASVSAASVDEIEIAGPLDLASSAAFLPSQVDRIEAPVVEPDEQDDAEDTSGETPDPIESAIDEVNHLAQASADAVDNAEALATSSAATSSDAAIGSVALAPVPSLSAAIDVRDIDGLDTETDEAPVGSFGQDQVAPGVNVDELIADRDAGVASLEAQVLSIQEARAEAEAAAQLTVGERAAVLADELGTASSEAEAQAAWDAGYALGGGSNLSAFHSTILPCESGSQANRDTVVGRTDDWGRAQINRPVWRTTFESLTGRSFEENIVHPALNGYMAAHIEQVQGLSAWTCWRNR